MHDTQKKRRNKMDFINATATGWSTTSNSLSLVTADGKRIEVPKEEFSVFKRTAPSGIPFEFSWLAGKNLTLAKLDGGIYSRKAVMETVLNEMEVGEIFAAKIVSIKPASAFLEYKGIFFHLARKEVSFSYLNNVDEYFTIGQKVPVMLLSKGDESNYAEVSYKRAYPDSLERYSSGDYVTLKITRFSQPMDCFFGEISPAVSGIIDVVKLPAGVLPLNYGDMLLCQVKNVTNHGLRLYGISLISRKAK